MILEKPVHGQNMKSISTIKPTIMENAECTIVKGRMPVIDIKVGVSP